MLIAGIDAGKTGALALLETDTDTLDIFDLELDQNETLDVAWLFDLLLGREIKHIITEDTFRPKSLVRMTGEIVAVAKILQTPIKVIAVTTWKNSMLGENTSNKEVSIKRCKEIFPETKTLLKRPRARTDSADRAEAILLAAYLRNTL